MNARSWTRPGRFGAALYASAAVVFGVLIAGVSRLQIAAHRGRRDAAGSLPDGAIIVVSNHASYADGILLALACRRLGRSIRLLATRGVFQVPVLGSLMTRLGFVPVDRGSNDANSSLDAALEALAAGEAIGIFPEGRMTRDPDHWPERAKTGAVRLALASGAPIIPVGMVGAHRVADFEHPVRSMLVSVALRPKVYVEVGDPIDIRALAGGDTAPPERIRDLSDEVMGAIVLLVSNLRKEPAPDPEGHAPTRDDKWSGHSVRGFFERALRRVRRRDDS